MNLDSVPSLALFALLNSQHDEPRGYHAPPPLLPMLYVAATPVMQNLIDHLRDKCDTDAERTATLGEIAEWMTSSNSMACAFSAQNGGNILNGVLSSSQDLPLLRAACRVARRIACTTPSTKESRDTIDRLGVPLSILLDFRVDDEIESEILWIYTAKESSELYFNEQRFTTNGRLARPVTSAVNAPLMKLLAVYFKTFKSDSHEVSIVNAFIRMMVQPRLSEFSNSPEASAELKEETGGMVCQLVRAYAKKRDTALLYSLNLISSVVAQLMALPDPTPAVDAITELLPWSPAQLLEASVTRAMIECLARINDCRDGLSVTAKGLLKNLKLIFVNHRDTVTAADVQAFKALATTHWSPSVRAAVEQLAAEAAL